MLENKCAPPIESSTYAVNSDIIAAGEKILLQLDKDFKNI
jgi:hypothetical protein